MKLKDKYTWIKHLDFIIIDLICLILSFIISYYIKFKSINIFVKAEWPIMLTTICVINLVCMFLQSTYSGILKKRYYQQFQKEFNLYISQIAAICVVLFAFKVGTQYSRQTIFLTYILYFLISQPVKYVRKKFLTGEFAFVRRDSEEIQLEEDNDTLELACLDKRSEMHKVISAFVKRIIDIVAGIVGCIILIPLTIFVFILNKLNEEDDGPVFYIQERIGKNGKKFKMFKYRSMVVDADEKLERFLEENEEIRKEFEINRKIRNDPRITKIGGFLRKTSLDEFPQFINVLLGDMSLVGPRAVVEDEIEKFGKYQKHVLSVKPGITGNWAANGRSDTTYEERVMLECQYVNKMSVRNDIKIIFKTIVSVLKKEGAV